MAKSPTTKSTDLPEGSLDSEEKKIEKRMAEFFQLIKNQKQEHDKAEDKELKKNIPDMLKGVHPKIQEDILNTLDELDDITEKDSKKLLLRLKNFMEKTYLDKRFDNIFDQKYLRFEIDKILDNLFSEEENSKTQKVALFSFDINGLKTVNDLGEHETGDEYLRRTVTAFENTSKFIQSKIKKEFNIKEDVEITHFVAGGDEFFIIINAKNTPDNLIFNADKLENYLSLYQEAVASIDCSDLIDFKNPKIKEKVGDVEIPEGFKWKATVSGGAINLNEAIQKTIIAGDIKEKEDYIKNRNAIKGGFIHSADQNAIQDKAEFKNSLLKEKVTYYTKWDHYLAYVELLQRNEESRRLERIIQLQDREIKVLREIINIQKEETEELKKSATLETAQNQKLKVMGKELSIKNDELDQIKEKRAALEKIKTKK